eukprot:scaffold1204_cov407-Prasinococcus_capsulatus_cf.AAC.13
MSLPRPARDRRVGPASLQPQPQPLVQGPDNNTFNSPAAETAVEDLVKEICKNRTLANKTSAGSTAEAPVNLSPAASALRATTSFARQALPVVVFIFVVSWLRTILLSLAYLFHHVVPLSIFSWLQTLSACIASTAPRGHSSCDGGAMGWLGRLTYPLHVLAGVWLVELARRRTRKRMEQRFKKSLPTLRARELSQQGHRNHVARARRRCEQARCEKGERNTENTVPFGAPLDSAGAQLYFG